jgi:hypothetical protein
MDVADCKVNNTLKVKKKTETELRNKKRTIQKSDDFFEAR